MSAVVGLGVALTGCGQASSTPASSAPTTSSAAASRTAETTPSSPQSTAPSSTPPITPAEPALCMAASLEGSLDASGGGAAGSVYMKLIVKNTSGTLCILDGYPGVSLVKSGTTTPIGAPAVRNPQAPSAGPISLAPGQSAAAVLQYTQAGNYQDCTQVPADAVLVYPPSATDSLTIVQPLTACSNADIALLHIGAFAP
ncbi:hypothetical protein AOC05_17790 [Arthrobacter alpinus]|uniref:DUF4232 domain-containing protein n=2 Tax=Arthrobacter TaxID=1663 RepID=A0A0M4RT76_9MICC|nr:hypothetical protein AOC05_17790 [Arthrobacter alpinus]